MTNASATTRTVVEHRFTVPAEEPWGATWDDFSVAKAWAEKKAEELGIRTDAAACGVAGAWALGRGLESLLYGVSGSDPLSYAVALSVLLAAALAATLAPARRALGIDPLTALNPQP